MQPSRICIHQEDRSLIFLIVRAISYVVSFVLIFSSFLFTILFIPYRYVIGLYLSKKYNHAVKFLDGLSTLFSMDNDLAPMHVQMYQVFADKIDIGRLRKRVSERWLRQEDNLRFRRILKHELGYFFWLPNPNLRLEDHILVYEGRQPRNTAELNAIASELSTSLPVKKEIFWQIHLIDLPDIFPGYENGPKCILCANCHHSLGDQITFLRFLFNLNDNPPDNSYIRSKPSLSFINRLIYFAKTIVEGPFNVLSLGAVRERHQLLGLRLTGVKLVSFSDQISLERLEGIADRTGTDLDSVLTTCVVGGLRSYFLSERISIPSTMRFLKPTLLPGSPFYKKNKSMSNSSCACFTLPIGATTSLDRLRQTKIITDEWDSNPGLNLGYLYALLCVNVSPSLFTKVAVDALQTTGVIVHIYGVKSAQSLLGCESIQGFATAATPGISGVSIATVAYNGFVTFGLKVDTAIMQHQDHLDKLIGFIVTEMYDLESASEKQKRPSF